jgi:hypothetical protein
MKTVVIAVLLAVMQAAPPIPRQTANSPTDTSKGIQNKTSNNQKGTGDAPTTIKSQPATTNQSNRDEHGEENTKHSIRVTELPAVTVSTPRRDWADWGTWGFNFLLALTGGFQVWLLCRTMRFVQRQTHEMTRQRITMGRQFRVMQNQVDEMAAQTQVLNASVAISKQSADAAKQSVEMQISKEKARISIEVHDLKLFPRSFESRAVRYRLDCLCPTPAFTVELQVNACIGDDTGVPWPVSIPPTIATTGAIEKVAMLFGVFDDDAAIRINRGELNIYFYGFVRYRDVFQGQMDAPHETRFRYVWRVAPPLSAGRS